MSFSRRRVRFMSPELRTSWTSVKTRLLSHEAVTDTLRIQIDKLRADMLLDWKASHWSRFCDSVPFDLITDVERCSARFLGRMNPAKRVLPPLEPPRKRLRIQAAETGLSIKEEKEQLEKITEKKKRIRVYLPSIHTALISM